MTTGGAQSPVRDEAQMISAILAGDTEQYHVLIRPYEHAVYKMALSFVKNESEAEDVAQEAFLKAFRDLASFRGESKFSTRLISITLNEARKRLRRQRIVRKESLDEPAEDGTTVHSPKHRRSGGQGKCVGPSHSSAATPAIASPGLMP